MKDQNFWRSFQLVFRVFSGAKSLAAAESVESAESSSSSSSGPPLCSSKNWLGLRLLSLTCSHALADHLPTDFYCHSPSGAFPGLLYNTF